ncbi:hypothetical protein SEA_WEASELS2_225 [Rhodococcus phage Weasels2]|uniref:Uncharacterized protein n=1 Tax=Rhodococcus phage Weasels2 TaxID=1897437 RepID=A0A1I9SAJ7_9CAUD|nr:hypothetical protein FDH04_gp191 [Rhodococcus phage Weasels2]AOZ63803.1 hypothetical protein SEA_WEASELS2_225 [Rhodococcus phage Weasels2]
MTKEQYKEKLINRITELMDEDNTLLNIVLGPRAKNSNTDWYIAVHEQREVVQKEMDRLKLVLKTL